MHVLTGSSCPHPFISAACPLCRGADAPGRQEAPASADAVVAAIDAAAGEPEIVLRDGDLLTRPEALDLLQHARQASKSLELWTSGLMLARPGVAEAVLRAGVSTLALPLYGDSAEAHDWVTGQPGHFQRVIAGLKRFRALGGKTAVIAPILRPTFRALPLLVQKSIALDVSAFRFVALPGPDRVAQPLLPSLEMVAPYVRQALQMTAAAKRRASVLDVPPCLLGDRAAEVAKDIDLRGEFHQFLPQLLELVDLITGTEMVVGSEIYMADLAYYQSVREAARRGHAGAETIYRDLQTRFPGAPKKPKPAPTP